MEKQKAALESVKEYYGKKLKTNQDLKTSACCTTDSVPLYLREILKDGHDEVKDTKYADCFQIKGDTKTHFGLFGCGPTSPIAVGQNNNLGACC